MISPGNKTIVTHSGQPFTLIYSLFTIRNVLSSYFEIQSKFGNSVEIALIRLKPEVAQKNDTVC